MISKIARALKPGTFLELHSTHDGATVAAYMMAVRSSGGQGDEVIGEVIAGDDAVFERLTLHMVGVDPPPSLTADELKAVSYVLDLVKHNLLSGCQDKMAKHHTAMVELFKSAAAKLVGGTPP